MIMVEKKVMCKFWYKNNPKITLHYTLLLFAEHFSNLFSLTTSDLLVYLSHHCNKYSFDTRKPIIAQTVPLGIIKLRPILMLAEQSLSLYHKQTRLGHN